MSDPRYWGKHIWPFLQASARHVNVPIALHQELYRLMPVNLPCHVCGEAECAHLHTHPILPETNMAWYVYDLRRAIAVRNANGHLVPAFKDVVVPLDATYFLPGLFRFLGVVCVLYPFRVANCDLSVAPQPPGAPPRTAAATASQRYQELKEFLAVLNRMLSIMLVRPVSKAASSAAQNQGASILAFPAGAFQSNTALLATLWAQEATCLGTPVNAYDRLAEILCSLTLEAKVDVWRQTLADRGLPNRGQPNRGL